MGNRLGMSHEYMPLAAVLQEALDQASGGKGKERHAGVGEPFVDQQIMRIQEWTGSNHFAVGQVVKKALESTRLPRAAARRELLGAIVYAAAAILHLDKLPVENPGAVGGKQSP